MVRLDRRTEPDLWDRGALAMLDLIHWQWVLESLPPCIEMCIELADALDWARQSGVYNEVRAQYARQERGVGVLPILSYEEFIEAEHWPRHVVGYEDDEGSIKEV